MFIYLSTVKGKGKYTYILPVISTVLLMVMREVRKKIFNASG
jgi:hypothetical protein